MVHLHMFATSLPCDGEKASKFSKSLCLGEGKSICERFATYEVLLKI